MAHITVLQGNGTGKVAAGRLFSRSPADSVAPGGATAGTSRRRLRADRMATWAVTAGGLAIIASILGIFLFILREVWPLTRGGDVIPLREIPVTGPPLEAFVADEHRTHVVGIDGEGMMRTIRLTDGDLVTERGRPGQQPPW